MTPHEWASSSLDRQGGDRHLGLGLEVRPDHLLEVHPVELVAREDQDQVIDGLAEVGDVAAHRVGGPLVPALVLHRLLRGQDLDEAAAEGVELVRIGDVPVQAHRVELRQDEDPVQLRVDAVGDRDVDQAVFARDGHRGLAPRLRQRKEAGPPPSPQDQTDDPAAHDAPLPGNETETHPDPTSGTIVSRPRRGRSRRPLPARTPDSPRCSGPHLGRFPAGDRVTNPSPCSTR